MHLRGPFVLLAIVCSALLPNSRPFGVSASGGSTQHTVEPVHAMQNMPPPVGVPLSSNEAARKERRAARKAREEETRIARAAERKAKAERAANELEVQNYKVVLKAAQLSADKRRSEASSLGWNARHETLDHSIPSKSSLVEVPLHPNEAAALKAKEDKDEQGKMELRALMRSPQRPPMDNHSVGRPLVDSPSVDRTLQMLDTLDLPREPSQEILNQLRNIYFMLSDDLNLDDKNIGKCIHIPDDSLMLSRLKMLAKYYALTMVSSESIATLPPFHELFCFSDPQMFPMMWFLREYIGIETSAREYAAIQQAFKYNAKRSDEIGPFAFDLTKRFSFSEVSEYVEKNKRQIKRKTFIYSPEKWVMRKLPVNSFPVGQSPDPLAPKKWIINSLSELVELHSGPSPQETASDLSTIASNLIAFLFTPIGQALLQTIELGSKFQFVDLTNTMHAYRDNDKLLGRGMTSERTLMRIWTLILRCTPKLLGDSAIGISEPGRDTAV